MLSIPRVSFTRVLSASNGVWYSFQLEGLDNLPQSVSPQTEPITLRSLTFISPPSTSESLAPPPRPSGEVSILSLGSSHVLIAAVSSGASPELTLLLWDLQYGVLLTSHTFAIPSTLPRNREQGIEITLAGGSPKNSQVILILSPPQLRASTEANLPSGKSTSSVLVVPITVPPTSTLANAMGRATAGAKWIAPSTLTSGTAPTQSSSPTLPDVDPTQAKLLKNLSMAFSQNRIAVAEEAFFKWVTNEETQRSAVNTKKTKYVKKMEAMDEEEKEWDARMSFGYGFVKAVLGMIFKEEKEGKHEKKSKTGEKGEGYSPKVVRFLLDEGLVCDGMVESGLLGALVARKDWVSTPFIVSNQLDGRGFVLGFCIVGFAQCH